MLITFYKNAYYTRKVEVICNNAQFVLQLVFAVAVCITRLMVHAVQGAVGWVVRMGAVPGQMGPSSKFADQKLDVNCLLWTAFHRLGRCPSS
jgi:hypothetical protein